MEGSMNTGLAIALLGMSIVFSFIALLALTIHLLARFKGKEMAPAPGISRETIAVISAAIHAHRFLTRRSERRDVS